MGIIAVFSFLGVIIGIAAYVLTALGLYKIAQKRGIENAWLAWIPVVQFYIVGVIIKEVKLGTLTIPRMDLVLPLGAVAVAVLSWIPVLGWLLLIAYYALCIYSLFLLYKEYVPDQAVLYTVLSAIGLFAIFIFIIRDKEPVAS